MLAPLISSSLQCSGDKISGANIFYEIILSAGIFYFCVANVVRVLRCNFLELCFVVVVGCRLVCEGECASKKIIKKN